jgi:hypothetical protein
LERSCRLLFTDRLSHPYLRSPRPLSYAHLRSPVPCAPNVSCHDISPPCPISVCFSWEEREASMAGSLPAAATDTQPPWQPMLIHCPLPPTRLPARTGVNALHCTLPFHAHYHRWRRRRDAVYQRVGKGIRYGRICMRGGEWSGSLALRCGHEKAVGGGTHSWWGRRSG